MKKSKPNAGCGFPWNPPIRRGRLPELYFKNKNKKGDIQSLPDDIITNILSRVPAECVLDCRRVCKRWRALTLAPGFAQLHLQRAKPGILVSHHRKKRGDSWWYFGGEGEKGSEGRKAKMLSKSFAQHLQLINPKWLFSCDGFLILQQKSSSLPASIEFVVSNPFTREEIALPSPSVNAKLCGFFFHSFTEEYSAIYVYLQEDLYRYMILSAQTMSWRQLTSSSSSCPISVTPGPAIVNGFLHWMVQHVPEDKCNVLQPKPNQNTAVHPCANSILRFNMQTEELDTMPHPRHQSCLASTWGEMELMETEGRLSLCHVIGGIVEVWILADYANWRWVQRYVANFFEYVPNDYYSEVSMHPICIKNGELAVCSKTLMFRYNLLKNTIKEIKIPSGKLPPDRTMFTTFTKSLVSLRKS